jgi:triacylglycerol lipase
LPFEPDTARLLARLSRIAYRDQTTAARQVGDLGLTLTRFFDGASTQAIIATSASSLYLAFRGTEKDPIDWAKNAQFKPIPGAMGGRVHKGFRLALDEVWNGIAPVLMEQPNPVLITGHSLGGALAVLAAARLMEAGMKPAAVYTYGQPRVGQSDFAGAFEAELGTDTYRVINHIDLVTRIPLLIQGYRHCGLRMYFDGSGRFHPKASIWRIARDDIKYRISHLRRIRAIGLDPHEIDEYVLLTDTL